MSPRIKTAIHLLAITVILFGLSWYFMSSLFFFVSDNGLRFIQIQELVQNQGRSFAVSYPARFLDPELEYTPFYFAYSLIGEDIYLSISPFLPFITALLYPLLDKFALTIVPVLGGVLTAAGIFTLGIIAEVKRPYLLMWTAVFATPVLFYCVQLWDHTIAVAFASWSIVGLAYGMRKERWQYTLLGGMALALGFGQRPEMYTFAIALGLITLIISWHQWRLWGAFITGVFIMSIPIWFLQWQWTGHPLGMATAPHLLDFGVREAYPFSLQDMPALPRYVKLSTFILFVQNRAPITFIAALLTTGGLLLTVLSLRISKWQKPWILILGFGLLVSGTMLIIWREFGEPIPGLLTAFPIAALALVFIEKNQDLPSRRRIYLLVMLTALVFLGLMLTLWPTSGGYQWGARYLLPVYPLFVFVAFYTFTTLNKRLQGSFLRTFQVVALGLLLVSVFAQVNSLYVSYESNELQKVQKEAINRLPVNLILTNNPLFPAVMAAVDKSFLYVDEASDFYTLVPRLDDAGISQFAFIPRQDVSVIIPDQVEGIKINLVSDFVYNLENPLEEEGDND